MRSIIDKINLAKVIASNLNVNEQPERFIEWASRESTTMADVLNWASKEEIIETQKKYNELEA